MMTSATHARIAECADRVDALSKRMDAMEVKRNSRKDASEWMTTYASSTSLKGAKEVMERLRRKRPDYEYKVEEKSEKGFSGGPLWFVYYRDKT